jgi:hypothetical protein
MKPKALMGVASGRIKREQKSDWTTPLSRGCQFFVALQFSRDDFSDQMCFVHRLVRHVGTHLNIGVDEAAVGL